MSFSADDQAFRAEVRRFFRDDYPADLVAKARSGASLSKADYQRSEQALAARGWLCVNWPEEHGGTGWSANRKYIFDEELEAAGAINVVPMGVIYVGPVICAFGTPEQQQRWLPGIQQSTTFWAQGYSEPESGSDLASLQCKAERDGDDYVITGTKIWTSLGQHADWIFCLVRTSQEERKQQGITFVCMDMATPGISVHPIITIDGRHSLNRVEFDGVRVPVANRVGPEGEGWRVANFLLGNERTSYAHVAAKRQQLLEARRLAASLPNGAGGLLTDDPAWRRPLADLGVRLDALEISVLRTLAAVADGDAPGPEASLLKIQATELAQDLTETLMHLHGLYAAPAFPDNTLPPDLHNGPLPAAAAPATAGYLGTRAQTIYGGTNEVQKNIIAKRVLGL